MSELISLTDAAKRLSVKPHLLSQLFWLGQLDGERCPIVGRVRIVPVDYLPAIRDVLVAKGKLPAESPAP